MSEPEQRDKKKAGWLQRRQRQSFVGDDDTDKPDFEKGSWAAIALVLVLIGLGIAMMLALAN